MDAVIIGDNSVEFASNLCECTLGDDDGVRVGLTSLTDLDACDAQLMRNAKFILLIDPSNDQLAKQALQIAAVNDATPYVPSNDAFAAIDNAVKTRNDNLQSEIHLWKRRAQTTQASTERIGQLQSWMQHKPIIAIFDHLNFKTLVTALCTSLSSTIYFAHSIRPSPTMDDILPMPCKPPSLHWTRLPSDAQLIWQFAFECGGIPTFVFEEIMDKCVNVRFDDVEYDYRWTDGLLVVRDAVKVHVYRDRERGNLNVVARVDVDESDKTMMAVLAPFVHAVFTVLSDTKNLPYTIHLLPEGTAFYLMPTNEEHAFHLHQLFEGVDGQVRFTENVPDDADPTPDRRTNKVLLKSIFDDARPATLSELKAWLADNQLEPQTRSRAQSNAAHSTASSIPEIMHEESRELCVSWEAGENRSPSPLDELYANNQMNVRRSSFIALRNPELLSAYRRADSTPQLLKLPIENGDTLQLSPEGSRRQSYGGGRRVSFSTVAIEGVHSATIEDPQVAVDLFVGALLADVYDHELH